MITKEERKQRKLEFEQKRAIFLEQYNWKRRAFQDLVGGKIKLDELVKDSHWNQVGRQDKAKLHTFSMAITQKNKDLINLFLQEEEKINQCAYGNADDLFRKWIESIGDRNMLELYDVIITSISFIELKCSALEGKIILPSNLIKYIARHQSRLLLLTEKVRVEHPELADKAGKKKKTIPVKEDGGE